MTCLAMLTFLIPHRGTAALDVVAMELHYYDSWCKSSQYDVVIETCLKAILQWCEYWWACTCYHRDCCTNGSSQLHHVARARPFFREC